MFSFTISHPSKKAFIAFKIKILGALSVGDGREKAYPLPAAFPKSLS